MWRSSTCCCLMTRKLFSFAKQESMEEKPWQSDVPGGSDSRPALPHVPKVSSTWFVHLSVSSTAVSTHFHISDVLYSLYICSMVTHTRKFVLCIQPIQGHTHTAVTHTHTHTHREHTHTPWTHIQSSGQPVKLRCPGSSALGARCLAQGHLVVVLKVERALDIHSPHLQFLPDRDSNSQPFA